MTRYQRIQASRNTTVLSNFAYVDQLWVVAGLSGICAVPVVRKELKHGVDDHPYLQSALDVLVDEIPVATVSDTVANREAIVGEHLDPGKHRRSPLPTHTTVDY